MGVSGDVGNRGQLTTNPAYAEASNVNTTGRESQQSTKESVKKRNSAARVIQKYVRTHLQDKGVLSNTSIPEYKLLCDRKHIKGMPEARGGKTHVYLPSSHPEIILKASGEGSKDRLNKMLDVRQALKDLECPHLIIPKAISCNGFLIEDRLPITIDSFHNMHCYTSAPELFDAAVQEMVRLSSKYHLTDLVNSQKNPLSHITDVDDFVRYDNIPLYLITENGKTQGVVGLIDLEHINDSVSGEALPSLVRIFPLHYQVIKDEAARLGMTFDENELNAAQAKGNKYLQVGYLDHSNYLKGKAVSKKSSEWSIDVASERFEKINGLLKKELLNISNGESDVFNSEEFIVPPPRNFLFGNAEFSAGKLSEKISPIIVSNIRKAANNYLIKEGCGKDLESLGEDQMVSLRSILVKRSEFYHGVKEVLNESSLLIDVDKIAEFENDIAEQLANVVINELVRGGEILDYDPAYYTGLTNICWLRY